MNSFQQRRNVFELTLFRRTNNAVNVVVAVVLEVVAVTQNVFLQFLAQTFEL